MRWAAHLGRRCGDFMYYVDGRHRRVALRNLTMCFWETRSPAEIVEIAQENFRRIGENICCAVKSTSLDDQALSQFLCFDRNDTIETRRALASRNVLLASGHFGGFELFSRISPHLAQYKHAATYRAPRQQELEELLVHFRSKAGTRLFERRAGAESLKKALSQGGLLLILFSDQSDRINGLELSFLGHAAYANRAPAVMAARYNCSLFVPICYRTAHGQYRIELGEPIPTLNADGSRRACEDITREINRAYETAILRDPANWFWVHNRWKGRIAPATAEPMAKAAAA